MTTAPIDAVDLLGQALVARTSDGREWSRGRAITYTDHPTFQIEREDGSRFSWLAELCTPASPGDPDTDAADRRWTLVSLAREVVAEAIRSIEKHGEQTHLPVGTGPDTRPLEFMGALVGSERLAHQARESTAAAHFLGETTWWDILAEEIFEATAEDDPAKLRAELVQVAAVTLKMIDALDRPVVPVGEGS